jgi:beta-glucosidase
MSSEIKPLYEVTPLEALTKKFGSALKINFVQGYEKQSTFKDGSNIGQLESKKVDWKLIDEAVEAAKKSDVAIIFGGLNHDFDTESFDKQDMKLPYWQETLIREVAKVNPRTIVVIIAGSPVELAGIAYRVPSILLGMVWWHGGWKCSG